MGQLPEKVFLRRSEILAAEIGISRYDLRRAVKAGDLARVVFPGHTYGKYRRADVVRVFRVKEDRGCSENRNSD